VGAGGGLYRLASAGGAVDGGDSHCSVGFYTAPWQLVVEFALGLQITSHASERISNSSHD
jgi:hypothetical protein